MCKALFNADFEQEEILDLNELSEITGGGARDGGSEGDIWYPN